MLIAASKLKIDSKALVSPDGSITYHDPCYLARVNGISDEPRELIEAAAGKKVLKEMKRNRCESS